MVSYSKKQNLKGFSLIEITVTLAVLMSFSLLIFPVGINQSKKSKLESYASQFATDLYYQQQRSRLKNIPSGISLAGNSYILYDGVSFSEATSSDIKKYPFNIHITAVALNESANEISFNPGSFRPNYFGSFKLTDQTNYITIYINEEGLVWYKE